jgi:hypothetical protein
MFLLGISDGGAIFAEWPENQQEAFCRAAGANADRNQMLFMAVAVALSVTGIVVTALAPATSDAMQAWDRNAILSSQIVAVSMKMDSDLFPVLGSYLMVSIDPDAVAALDSDWATAIDSARAESVKLRWVGRGPTRIGRRRSTQIRLQCPAWMGWQ